ncbi:glycosyltransferase family 1 protein [Roseiarcaceae bacterium H3SJ34-1]|uniref:glycosyltransferase family 4 protein n=1 Tax=Terripilifer ovatus TaxID=3032367 RepID=UPI003AB956BC|nr:glycosyltransferase family 1 protein [Roseiarcaceae bacterium H3SJ34-1]
MTLTSGSLAFQSSSTGLDPGNNRRETSSGPIAQAPDGQKPLVLINHLVEPPGRITGITRYAFGLIEALVARGTYRYALATAFSREQLPETMANGLDRILTFPYVESTPLNFIRQHAMLKAAASEASPQLIYAINPMCPSVNGLPTIITAHDLYMKTLPDMYPFRHRLWWSVFFNRAARQAARIACVSRNTQSDVIRFYPSVGSKTCLVSGAGVLPRRSPSSPPEQLRAPYILLLGNLTPNKNAGFLVAALKQLRAKGITINAYHVGRDAYGALNDVDGLIEQLGGIDDERLNAMLGSARALVTCSSYEGFGLPIIEAHDRGVPVIASDIPIFREVAGDGALFIQLGDVAGFAASIEAIIANDTLHASLSKAAIVNAKRYTWNNSAAAAEAQIAALVAAHA